LQDKTNRTRTFQSHECQDFVYLLSQYNPPVCQITYFLSHCGIKTQKKKVK